MGAAFSVHRCFDQLLAKCSRRLLLTSLVASVAWFREGVILAESTSRNMAINTGALTYSIHPINKYSNAKMGDPNHPHQREAFNIFQGAWQDLQQCQHDTPSPTCDDIIQQAASKLAAAIIAEPLEQTAPFLYSTLSALVDYALQSPASLDLMLQS
jgi:hypothetical protein